MVMMKMIMNYVANYDDNNYDCECLSNINDNDARSQRRKQEKAKKGKKELLPFCFCHMSDLYIVPLIVGTYAVASRLLHLYKATLNGAFFVRGDTRASVELLYLLPNTFNR